MVYELQHGSYWTPTKEKDFLEGIIIKIEDNTFDNKDFHIQRSAKEDPIIVSATTLLTDLLKDADAGNKVKITFLGEKNTGKGNPLKLFEVLLDKEID